MEVVRLSVRGFRTPPGYVQVSNSELFSILQGTNDDRKSGLLQGIRLMLLLANQGWPPIGGAFQGLDGVARDACNSDLIAPLELAAEISTSSQDRAEIPGPLMLNLERLRVRFEVRADHPMAPAGWTVRQFEVGDGKDFANQDATAVTREIRAAMEIIGCAMGRLLEQVRSPRPDAWLEGEAPVLDVAELIALDLLAGVRFKHIRPGTDEHLYRKRHPRLAGKIDQTVEALVSKRCVERIAISRGHLLDITPTGLLACSRGGEADGLAMGIARMMQQRSEADGEAFTYYTLHEAMPFNFGASTADFLPFAATVLEVLRLTPPGSTTMWSPYDMRSLLDVTDIRGLRQRAELLRQMEAAEAERAAAEAAAFSTVPGPTPAAHAGGDGRGMGSGGDDRRGGNGRGVGPATILFLGANPSATTRLALDEEVREIQQRIHGSDLRDAFRIEQAWAVRASDLQACLLRHRPTIVHFSGHGDAAGELVLVEEGGAARPVSTAAIAGLFRVLGKNVRCVVLNACFSEAQARAVAEHVDCVVGMAVAVEDSGALAFAGAFYQALGYGESVQTAFDLGCNRIELSGSAQGDVPRLVTRSGVLADEVRLGMGVARP